MNTVRLAWLLVLIACLTAPLRAAQGQWFAQSTLKPSDHVSFSLYAPLHLGDDRFATAIDTDGNFLAVGAPCTDSNVADPMDNSKWDTGSVYVFERTPTGWRLDGYLKSALPWSHAKFGTSVSLCGDLLVVGVPEFTPSQHRGVVEVFRRQAGTWQHEATLWGSKTWDEHEFGFSVATDGEWIVVGAPNDDTNASGIAPNALPVYYGPSAFTGVRSGAIYVFRRVQGAWVEETFVKSDAPFWNEQFGATIALDEGRIAVGGGLAVPSGSQPHSRIHTYTWSGSEWQHEQSFVPPQSGPPSSLPREVHLDGAILASTSIEGTHAYQRTINGWESFGALPWPFAYPLNSSPGPIALHNGVMAALTYGEVTLVRLVNGVWEPDDRFPCIPSAKNITLHDGIVVLGDPNDSSASVGIDGPPVAGTAPNSGAAYTYLHDPNLNWHEVHGCDGPHLRLERPAEPPRIGSHHSIEVLGVSYSSLYFAVFLGTIELDANGCGSTTAPGFERLLSWSPTPAFLTWGLYAYDNHNRFDLSIPNDPSLIGRRFALQGASVYSGSLIAYSEALEFEIRP
jgi:hypothetical protein